MMMKPLFPPLAPTAARPAAKAAGRSCPRCQGHTARVARLLPDRLLSLVMPVKRYRCLSRDCGWEGLLLHRSSPPARLTQRMGYRPRIIEPSRLSTASEASRR